MSNDDKSMPQSSLMEDGTIRVSAFDLPLSSLLDSQTRRRLLQLARRTEHRDKMRPSPRWYDPDEIPALRAFCEEHVLSEPLRRVKTLYDVHIQPETLVGVYTEVFTPADGVPTRNAERVLINLHGGAFTVGARCGGQLESIAVAALSQIKVVSVDYRMAPEHRFPAATDDVVAVYRQLLKEYAPENIGIFGCSAGAVLTAQTVARLQKECLPQPAAVGMFCAAASYWGEGDSGRLAASLLGLAAPDVVDLQRNPYFEQADPNDPLVTPVRFADVMAKFPPSLLISATRDVGLSSVAHTHSRLVALGVEADLHVWEGSGHAFLYDDPDLPQSREAHEVIVKFFDRHLGGQSSLSRVHERREPRPRSRDEPKGA